MFTYRTQSRRALGKIPLNYWFLMRFLLEVTSQYLIKTKKEKKNPELLFVSVSDFLPNK